MRRSKLTLSEARRIALAAQGFDRPRPAAVPDKRHFRRLFNTLGLLQLDYVNVLMPAHFLIAWSRFGAYDRGAFEKYLYQSGETTEQWAHEASIVTADAWPLLQHRRKAYKMHNGNPLRRIRNRKSYLDAALRQAEEQGSITAADLPPVPGPKRKPGDWHRSIPRWALEYHFASGSLAVANRLPNFQRVFDLPSRILSPNILASEIDERSAQQELIRRAANALGVATVQDMADYYRMPIRDTQPSVEALVKCGELAPVAVEGWSEQAYLSTNSRLPREIAGHSLLSPFDPVVWFRPRALRLFGFHYRIEIYVPAAKRKWGYYVLPFRLGEDIVARVDVKADRHNSALLVLAVHEEPDFERQACVDALAQELQGLQRWLGLQTIRVTSHNPVSRKLAVAVRG
ncbi:MAG: winged helix-turn-helix domain-containing protein [Woeseiaceae bacterium]